MKSRIRAQARPRSDFRPLGFLSFSLILAVVLVVWAGVARSQTPAYPRVGVSASPTEYVDSLDVVTGEEFTLYVCVFGPGPGEPVGQPFTSLSWVIHQVCCGAEIDINHMEYNPDLDHEGHPLLGVRTTTEDCFDQDSVLLATLTCRMTNPTPGGVLWAAGPLEASYDCSGGNALFMGMAVTLNAEPDPTPVEGSRWGSLKALYR